MLLCMESKNSKNKTINPRPFLIILKKKLIVVKLKWGMEYKGILISFDKYMNIYLKNAEEWLNEKKIGFLGEILIRCNNILYISNNSIL
mmetsp:Transcript_28289/g.71200  ORF Transcript_28289/g.71200 Transcript_28289/m.71200 type:complete len:89 (+) Transcript_28289:282-548(+)